MENLKFNIRMHSLSFTHRFFIVIVATSTQKRILSIRWCYWKRKWNLWLSECLWIWMQILWIKWHGALNENVLNIMHKYIDYFTFFFVVVLFKLNRNTHKTKQNIIVSLPHVWSISIIERKTPASIVFLSILLCSFETLTVRRLLMLFQTK